MILKTLPIKRILFFSVPLMSLIIGNLSIYSFVLKPIMDRNLQAAVSAIIGLIFFTLLIIIISHLSNYAQIVRPRLGRFNGLVLGLLVGLIVSLSSGFLFSKNHSLEINWTNFKDQLPLSTLLAVAPATVEEAVFRFGIVHGTTALLGPAFGLVAGSLPFGVLHLLNIVVGQTTSLEQVLGTTLAGLLLSLLFLKYGLWAAIGCHFIWNSFSGPWIKAMGLTGVDAISSFEGAWTTSIVLGFTVVTILFFSRIQNTPFRKLALWQKTWRRSIQF